VARAKAAATRALALDPLLPEALTSIAYGTRLQKPVDLRGAAARSVAAQAAAYAAAGDWPAAERIFHELERRAKREFVGPFAFATIYAALGDRDRGVDWLLRGIEQGHNFMTEKFFDPLLDPLRKDQRYPEVLAGMGLGS
jgi:hypothetical protein